MKIGLDFEFTNSWMFAVWKNEYRVYRYTKIKWVILIRVYSKTIQ